MKTPLDAARMIALCSGGKSVRFVLDGKVHDVKASTLVRKAEPVEDPPIPAPPVPAIPDLPSLLVMQHIMDGVARTVEKQEAMITELRSEVVALRQITEGFTRDLLRPMAPKYDKHGKLLGVQRVDSI